MTELHWEFVRICLFSCTGGMLNYLMLGKR